MLDNLGHVLTDQTWEELVGDLHHRGLYAPHISESFCHLQTNEPSTNDERVFDLAACNSLFNSNGRIHIAHGENSLQIDSGYVQTPGTTAGGKHKLVIG